MQVIGKIQIVKNGIIKKVDRVAGKGHEKYAKMFAKTLVDILEENGFKLIDSFTLGEISSSIYEYYIDENTSIIGIVRVGKDIIPNEETVYDLNDGEQWDAGIDNFRYAIEECIESLRKNNNIIE